MIKFNVIQRKNPKTGKMLYYSQALTNGHLTLDSIAENISRECTVTIHDIKAVLSALEEQIVLALREGRSVRFGDLGSFHVTLRSIGAETLKKFSIANIERVRVRFIQSSGMRGGLLVGSKNMKFKYVGEKEIAAPDVKPDEGEDPNA